MKSLQELFFEELDRIAERYKLQVIRQMEYANCGVCDLIGEHLDSILSFHFQFSSGHNVFKSEIPFFLDDDGNIPSNPKMDIVKTAGELSRVLWSFENHLIEIRTEPVS